MPQHLRRPRGWHLPVCAEQEVRADAPALSAGTCPGEEGPHVGLHGHHTWVPLLCRLAVPRLWGAFPVPGGETVPLSLVLRRDRCPQEPASGLTDARQPRARLGQQRGRGAQLQGGLQHPGRGALPRSPGAARHRSHHPGHPRRYACTHVPFLPLLLFSSR